MDTKKEVAMTEVDREIAALARMRDALQLLPDGLPGRVWATDGNVRLSLPFNPEAIRQARQLLGQSWKRIQTFGYKARGDLYLTYRHNSGVELVIDLDTTREGATCQRIKIGESMHPIYKVVCR